MKLENLFEANTGETYIAQIAGTGEDYSWDLINASNKQEATKIAQLTKEYFFQGRETTDGRAERERGTIENKKIEFRSV